MFEHHLYPVRIVTAKRVVLFMQTFVIDKNGKCVMSFNDQIGAEKHVEEALKVVETLV